MPTSGKLHMPGNTCLMWSAPPFAETDGRIGPSFGWRVSRRPNEGGQAKRGSPPAGRRPEITDPWLAGLLARSLSRRCGNVVRTIRRATLPGRRGARTLRLQPPKPRRFPPPSHREPVPTGRRRLCSYWATGSQETFVESLMKQDRLRAGRFPPFRSAFPAFAARSSSVQFNGRKRRSCSPVSS